MSRWITLNVLTEQPESLIERLDEFTAYSPEGEQTPDLVLYSFMSRSSTSEKEVHLRAAAEIALDSGAEAVLGIEAGDTADWAACTGFTTDSHGEVAQVDLGHSELYSEGHQQIRRKVGDRYGFEPDLGGNYRRDRWGHFEMYSPIEGS